MNSLNLWAKKPELYFAFAVIFYGAFELLNSTVVCRSANTIASTGLFSFLGFWSLVLCVILLFKRSRQTKKFDWLWIAVIALIILLFLLDYYIAQTCFFN